MNYFEESLKLHEEKQGKISVVSKVKVETRDDLSLAYTPGVAESCRKIHEDEENVYDVLAFSGIFRGALDVRAKEINEEMKIAAAYAIAEYINDEDLNENNVIPSALDKNVAKKVAEAIAKAARESGVARN